MADDGAALSRRAAAADARAQVAKTAETNRRACVPYFRRSDEDVVKVDAPPPCAIGFTRGDGAGRGGSRVRPVPGRVEGSNGTPVIQIRVGSRATPRERGDRAPNETLHADGGSPCRRASRGRSRQYKPDTLVLQNYHLPVENYPAYPTMVINTTLLQCGPPAKCRTVRSSGAHVG